MEIIEKDLDEKEVIAILNEHYARHGLVVKKAKRSDSLHYLLEITTVPATELGDIRFRYDLERLEITDHLFEKVIAMPRQRRNNRFDFSSLNKDEAKAVIRNHILTQLSEHEQKIMIEVYQLCPNTITKDAARNLKGKIISRSVEKNLTKAFPGLKREEIWNMVPLHQAIINSIRDALHDFQEK